MMMATGEAPLIHCCAKLALSNCAKWALCNNNRTYVPNGKLASCVQASFLLELSHGLSFEEQDPSIGTFSLEFSTSRMLFHRTVRFGLMIGAATQLRCCNKCTRNARTARTLHQHQTLTSHCNHRCCGSIIMSLWQGEE